MQGAWDWDDGNEQEKERRLQERRQRVQERLAAQKQSAAGPGGGGGGEGGAQARSRGQQEAQLGAEAVRQLREQCDAAATAVRDEAERREEQQRETWDQQAAWLREEIAAESESCKQHARAIDLEWEAVHNATTPQQARDAMAVVRQHCEQVLQSKEDLLAGIRSVLRERDEAYMRLLQRQTEETDALIALMAQEYDKFKRGQEQALESVEAAYLQERSELISSHKAELDALLEKRSALEQGFMEQYLQACEAYEGQLEAMRRAEADEYVALKRRLEGEVASLEAHLDSMRSVYMLNADKLQYNMRVLSERERENREALQQQKRKITRQWEVLSRLKKRHAALDARFREENLRLADEYQRVTRAFNHLQAKFRHFKAADLRRFAKIRDMKEEDLDELLLQLAEADATIRLHVLGVSEAPAPAGAEAAGAGCPEAAGGLAVVGRALTASAEAPHAGALVDEESEVVVLSGQEVAQREQLISAYRPGSTHPAATPAGAGAAAECAGEPGVAAAAGQGTAASAGERSGAPELPPLAWQELSESLEAGVLSLLLAGARAGSSSSASTGRVDGGKVQRLLQQLPEAAPGRWEPAGVVRGLGVQHDTTQRALEALLCGAGTGQGEQQEAAGQAAASGPSSSAGGGSSSTDVDAAANGRAPAPALLGTEQVQQGLQQLVNLLQGDRSRSGTPHSPAPLAQRQRQAAAAEPTSAAYWEGRVAAALLPEVFRAWALLEPQLARLLRMLQSRSKAAEEVAALQAENEALKARLKDRLMAPENDELQLPTRLLLQ